MQSSSTPRAELTSSKEVQEFIQVLLPGLRTLVLRSSAALDAAEREDILAEALLILVERLPGLLEQPGLTADQKRGRAAAFAAQLLRNLMFENRRKQARLALSKKQLARLPDEQSSLDEVRKTGIYDSDAELTGAVRALLKELPNERDRQVLMRFYLEDNDAEKISQDFNLSEGEFHRVLMRARTRLRELIRTRSSLESKIFG